MKVLCIGDIIGRTGRNAVREFLPKVIEKYNVELIIANGENAAAGAGITKKVYNQLKEMDIDVLTSGNHIWDKKEVLEFIDKVPDLLKPANYPPTTPGKGYYTFEKNGKKITVVNLMGRVFIGIPLDCPFRKFDEIYEKVKEISDYIIVDFHGEATSEKQAFGFYVDGRANIVFGTHSHVQTSDERFLENGTAFITDVGLSGTLDSVIGVKKEEVIQKFLNGMPVKYDVAKGKLTFQALFVDIENKKIERIKLTENE